MDTSALAMFAVAPAPEGHVGAPAVVASNGGFAMFMKEDVAGKGSAKGQGAASVVAPAAPIAAARSDPRVPPTFSGRLLDAAPEARDATAGDILPSDTIAVAPVPSPQSDGTVPLPRIMPGEAAWAHESKASRPTGDTDLARETGPFHDLHGATEPRLPPEIGSDRGIVDIPGDGIRPAVASASEPSRTGHPGPGDPPSDTRNPYGAHETSGTVSDGPNATAMQSESGKGAPRETLSAGDRMRAPDWPNPSQAVRNTIPPGAMARSRAPEGGPEGHLTGPAPEPAMPTASEARTNSQDGSLAHGRPVSLERPSTGVLGTEQGASTAPKAQVREGFAYGRQTREDTVRSDPRPDPARIAERPDLPRPVLTAEPHLAGPRRVDMPHTRNSEHVASPDPIGPDAGAARSPSVLKVPANAGATDLSGGLTGPCTEPGHDIDDSVAKQGDATRSLRAETVAQQMAITTAQSWSATGPAPAVAAPIAVAAAPVTGLSADGTTEDLPADALPDLVGFSETLRGDVARSVATPAAQAALPPQTALQIADALKLAPGTVELTLTPEELGKVTLKLEIENGAMTVQVMAERPETQQMLRRHMDVLLQDARDAGFADVTFDMTGGQGGAAAQDRGDGGSNQTGGQSEGGMSVTAATPFQTAARPATRDAASGNLDIRL